MIVPDHHAGGPSDPRALAGAAVLVVGAGVSGQAAARALHGLGARVVVCDDSAADIAAAAAAEAAVTGSAEAVAAMPSYALMVVSPGVRPDNPLCVSAHEAGVPVWGDVELAWRCDRSGVFGAPRRWLAVTGTNGKTTTTTMLESILRAAGAASCACGNIGLPVLDALSMEPRVDVLAVELSSFQLHWAPSVVPEVSALLNIAEDHLDWHGGMDAYIRAKAQVLRGSVALLGVDDPIAASLAPRSDAVRTVGFTLGEPAPGQLGVRGAELLDRAFPADTGSGAGGYAAADSSGDSPCPTGSVLASAANITPGGAAGTLDALAAAGVARAAGIGADAVREGLEAHEAGAHRAAFVATIDGVDYVDDSKATNPHAAFASMRGRGRIVWIAGGLLKGASVDVLVSSAAERLDAAVLIGRDRGLIAESLARHAADVPVTVVSAGDDARVQEESSDRVARVVVGGDDDAMPAAVSAAARYARPGSTVLLAPAAASLDMYRNYGARGDAFVAAVEGLRPRRRTAR